METKRGRKERMGKGLGEGMTNDQARMTNGRDASVLVGVVGKAQRTRALQKRSQPSAFFQTLTRRLRRHPLPRGEGFLGQGGEEGGGVGANVGEDGRAGVGGGVSHASDDGGADDEAVGDG